MPLDHPYIVFGLVTDTGVPVNLAVVYAQDITVGSAIINVTTGADGSYILDLMDIATDGDIIHLWVVAPNGKTQSLTFILDISGDAEERNLAVSAPATLMTVLTATSQNQQSFIGYSKNE